MHQNSPFTSTDCYDLLKLYGNLFSTESERESMFSEGIQSTYINTPIHTYIHTLLVNIGQKVANVDLPIFYTKL